MGQDCPIIWLTALMLLIHLKHGNTSGYTAYQLRTTVSTTNRLEKIMAYAKRNSDIYSSGLIGQLRDSTIHGSYPQYYLKVQELLALQLAYPHSRRAALARSAPIKQAFGKLAFHFHLHLIFQNLATCMHLFAKKSEYFSWHIASLFKLSSATIYNLI